MTAQRTIAKEGRVAGCGLHSGEHVDVVFKPAPVDHGMVFVRTDLEGSPSIRAHPDRLCQRMRRTAMAEGDVEVHTTEHFLAAAYGLGIDNLIIEINGVELPGLDGSAMEFANCLREAGIVEQDTARNDYNLEETITVKVGDAHLVAMPYAEGLKITYTLDDHGGALKGAQMVEVEVNENDFMEQIAPARTFCLAQEVEALRAMGLGKGATYQNTCVFDGEKVVDNELRFTDEPARHKMLDLIGDLAHTTRRVNCHIIAMRSGHRENGSGARVERIQVPSGRRMYLMLPIFCACFPTAIPSYLLIRWWITNRVNTWLASKTSVFQSPIFKGTFLACR